MTLRKILLAGAALALAGLRPSRRSMLFLRSARSTRSSTRNGRRVRNGRMELMTHQYLNVDGESRNVRK